MKSLEDIKSDFSNGFENFLERKGIKGADIAKQFGINPASVSCWKIKKALPIFDKAVKLLEMGMTVQEMFGEELGNQIIKNSLLSQGVSDIPEEKLKLLNKDMRSMQDGINKRFEDVSGLMEYSFRTINKLVNIQGNGLDDAQKTALLEDLESQKKELERMKGISSGDIEKE